MDTIQCRHQPPCPPASSPGNVSAAVVRAHPEQGWNLLCNGVILFDDGGYLLPDAVTPGAHRRAA